MDNLTDWQNILTVFQIRSIEQHSQDLHTFIHQELARNVADEPQRDHLGILSNEVSRMVFLVSVFFPTEGIDRLASYVRTVVTGYVSLLDDAEAAQRVRVWIDDQLNDLVVVSFSIARGVLILDALNQPQSERPFVVLSSTGELLAAGSSSDDGNWPIGTPIGFV
jgi:hypothetical protein